MAGFSDMTHEQLVECGKRGAAKSAEAKSKKREMRETLNILLNMPAKRGKVHDAEEIKAFADLKGKNLSIEQCMMIQLVQQALKGDLKAIEMVRDTIGQKPTERIDYKDITPVIISGEDDLCE